MLPRKLTFFKGLGWFFYTNNLRIILSTTSTTFSRRNSIQNSGYKWNEIAIAKPKTNPRKNLLSRIILIWEKILFFIVQQGSYRRSKIGIMSVTAFDYNIPRRQPSFLFYRGKRSPVPVTSPIQSKKRSLFGCQQLPILVEEDRTSDSTVGRCQLPIILEEVKELARWVKEVQSVLTIWQGWNAYREGLSTFYSQLEEDVTIDSQ